MHGTPFSLTLYVVFKKIHQNVKRAKGGNILLRIKATVIIVEVFSARKTGGRHHEQYNRYA